MANGPLGPPSQLANVAAQEQFGPPTPGAGLSGGPPAPVGQPTGAQLAPQVPPSSAEGPGPLQQFTDRLGKASISFLTGVPQIELDRQALNNKIIDQQASNLKQQGEAQLAATAQEQQLKNLFSTITNPETPVNVRNQATAQAIALDPELTQNFHTSIGITEQRDKNRLADRALEVQGFEGDRGKQNEVLGRQIAVGEAEGRDMTHTRSLLEATDQELNTALSLAQVAALTPAQRIAAARGDGTPADVRTFESLAGAAELSPEERQKAARVELGLDARAGTRTAPERIAGDVDLAGDIGKTQGIIEEGRKFGQLTGSSRARQIDAGIDQIQKIDVNIRNLDDAITALEEGAQTGAVVTKFTPTVRAATTALEQVQGRLALDVIGAVTFGALSQGELDLARAVALPTNLPPAELIQWIQDKQAAQNKLRGYYAEQVDFLDQGGTVAGFLRNKERQGGQGSTQTGGGGDRERTFNVQTGQFEG